MTDLTPTEDLLMEAVAARHRLGENEWTVDARHARTVKALMALGLVSARGGIVYRTMYVRLTDEGRAMYLRDNYEAPDRRRLELAHEVAELWATIDPDATMTRAHAAEHLKRVIE